MQEQTCQVIHMDQVQTTETEWIWYPYIPRGKVTIIQGDPGEGKSTFSLYLAAAVSRGTSVECPNQVITNPDYVVYQNAEDGLADTVKPRLDLVNANCSLVICLDEARFPLSMTDNRLELILEKYHPRMLILDPLQAYLGDCVDMHRANEIRPVMNHLAVLADNFQCAIILIGHMNKMQGSKAIYRGLGSIDITASARSVLTVARDPSHPEFRVIRQIKNSLAKEGEPVAFKIGEDGSIEYAGPYQCDDPYAGENGRQPKERDRAKKLLAEWMERKQPLYVRDIYEIADSEDIKKTTLLRAKADMGIIARYTERGWIWEYPKKKA